MAWTRVSRSASEGTSFFFFLFFPPPVAMRLYFFECGSLTRVFTLLCGTKASHVCARTTIEVVNHLLNRCPYEKSS